LEVFEATGRPLAEWQTERERPLIPLSRAFPIVATTDRAELYRRCDLRFDAMIAAIARVHRATLATRNTGDFEHCGIRLINPWTAPEVHY